MQAIVSSTAVAPWVAGQDAACLMAGLLNSLLGVAVPNMGLGF